MISLSALVLAGLYGVMVSKQSESLQYQNERKSEKIAEHVSFQAEMALVQGDGYSRVLSIPQSVGGHNYTVKLVNGSGQLEWGNSSIIQPSRYRGEAIWVNTSVSNIYRVLNRDGEVSLVAE